MTDPLVLRVDFEGWARVVPLDGPVMVGRGPECAVRLPDPRLSRQHAVFRATPAGCEVEDLGSSAGTRVDGQPVVVPRPLRVGDRVEVGPITVELALAEPAGPGPAPVRADPLVEVVADLYASPDPEALLGTVVARALQLVGAERGAVMVSADGGLAASVARDASGKDLPPETLLSKSMVRKAMTSGEVVVVSDFETADVATPHSVMLEGLRSVVVVPLPGPAGPMGALYLDARRAVGAFGKGEIALLTALATHAALALERARLRDADLRREVDRRATLEAENATLRARLSDGAPVGSSPGMRKVGDLVRQLAPSDVTVCLTGETGTGKEVVARWLHATSGRAKRPFVAVDCGSIPEGLIESELFGHTKGAFTGAAGARLGHFREAEGGTIFLDEIGELPLALQTRLLRVLQERTVQPVGATGRIPVDVRVVCATHRDLEAAVREGRFRQDLYYRLAVVTIPLPPLRARGDDILLLAHHFLATEGGRSGRRYEGFDDGARTALLGAPWEGNVRELQHRIQRAVVLGRPPRVSADDLGFAAPVVAEAPVAAAPAPRVEPAPAEDEPLPSGPLPPLTDARADATARFERAYLARVLARTSGNMAAAAELAGVSRQAIHRLVALHGIDRKQYRHGRDE